MTNKEWFLIGISILLIISIIVIPRTMYNYYFDNNKVCANITKVYVCGGYKNNSECRVELDNGTRKTTNRLVAEGDEYCWLP